jgi:hypothetical protein
VSSWVAVAVAVLSALGAIAAAVIAGMAAARTKKAEIDAARLVELEKRLATTKEVAFEPFVVAVGRFFDGVGQDLSPEELFEILGQPLRDFMNSVQIYGSDDTVRAAMHLMQAMYHDAPPLVQSRLLGDLLLQLRRELGDPGTAIGSADMLGIRMNDAFTDPEHHANLSDSLDKVFARHSWTPPWLPAAGGTEPPLPG